MASDRPKLQQYQCACCGHILNIHKDEVGAIRSDIYYDLHCPRCKCVTAHLDVGEDILDFYELSDNTWDERYFQYKTK